MAQHRTKEDKQSAQIHRLEQSKLYSLSALDGNTKTTVLRPEISTKKSAVSLLHVKEDLLRTVVSTIVVLTLLALGTYYLG